MQGTELESLNLKLKNRFQIVKKLGSGAAATVYLAVDKEHGNHQVALKVLSTDADYDIGAVRRFCNEFKALCNLQHPNLIEAYDLIEQQGLIAYTMEYVPGRSLLELATVDKLPYERTSLIVAQILGALSVLHDQGIAHRDIKLENILFREDGLVKLSDLGLLKSYGQISQTRTGILLGTTHYLPPEYIRYGIYDAQSDIYAVGLLLYECLLGKRWLEAKDSDEALKFVAEKAFVFPRLALAGLPPKFQRILKYALDPEPRHRYSSAEEMRQALLSESGKGEGETVVQVQDTGAFSRDFFAAQAMETYHGNRRSRRLAFASVSGSVAAVSTLVVALVGSPIVPDTTPIASHATWNGEVSGKTANKQKISIEEDGTSFRIINGFSADELGTCKDMPKITIGSQIDCAKNTTLILNRTKDNTFQLSYTKKISAKNIVKKEAALHKQVPADADATSKS